MATTPSTVDTITGKARSAVLGIAADNPAVASLLGKVGVDVQGIDEMFVRLKDSDKLTSDINALKTDKTYEKLYNDLEAKARDSLNKGDFSQLLDALKGKKLSDGSTLDETTIKANLAKTIAYVSVKEIKKEIPTKWSLAGDSFGDIWDKSFASLKSMSFSEKPLQYLGEVVSGVINLVKGIVFEPGIMTHAEEIAKSKASTKREEIALRVGGELASRGIMGAISGTVMAEMYDQLGQQSEPKQPLMSAEEKQKKSADLLSKLPKAQTQKLREGVGEFREDPAADAAKRHIPESDKERPWYKKAKDYLLGRGQFKQGEGMQGSIYDADMTGKYGLDLISTMKIGAATAFTLTKEGEMKALQEGIASANPNIVVTFHDGDNKGRKFTPGVDKTPETVVIGLSKKQGDKPDFYYLRTPGFSVGNAGIVATDVAKGVLATVTLPEAAIIAAPSLATGGLVVRGALALGLPTATLGALDGTSKALSGGKFSDADLGEAFYQTIASQAVGKAGAKVLEKIPTQQLGEWVKSAAKGLPLGKADAQGMTHVVAKDGKEMVFDRAAMQSIKEAATTFAKKHPIITAGGALYGTSAIASSSSTPNGATPPPPPPTPAVAPSPDAPSHFIGDTLR